MRELSGVHVIITGRKLRAETPTRAGYWFDCAWDGKREQAENDFSNAQLSSPHVTWMVWQTGHLWVANIGGPEAGEVARFQAYLLHRGWAQKPPQREAG